MGSRSGHSAWYEELERRGTFCHHQHQLVGMRCRDVCRSVTSVRGKWTVPGSPGRARLLLNWVGIDGFNSAKVETDRTPNKTWSNGHARVLRLATDAIELIVNMPIAVNPGYTIVATVDYLVTYGNYSSFELQITETR